jgi:hypothetical protein
MGFILSLVAPILFLLLTPINMLIVIWKNARTQGFFKTVNGYFMQSARDMDIFGNSNLKTFFNAAFIKTRGYQFGREGETISSVLGKNQRDKTLICLGWVIVYILWGIDVEYWKKGGHCMNSIVEQDEVEEEQQ